MSTTWPNKDPDDILDYSIDWGRLLDDGDAIASVVWIVPTGLTGGVELITGAITTVWLSGGSAGQSYDVTARVTTSGGRQMDRSGRLFVTEA
jgi:hypothetical protein